jgi:hypothetical protein
MGRRSSVKREEEREKNQPTKQTTLYLHINGMRCSTPGVRAPSKSLFAYKRRCQKQKILLSVRDGQGEIAKRGQLLLSADM